MTSSGLRSGFNVTGALLFYPLGQTKIGEVDTGHSGQSYIDAVEMTRRWTTPPQGANNE